VTVSTQWPSLLQAKVCPVPNGQDILAPELLCI